jgi:hypothetical protein
VVFLLHKQASNPPTISLDDSWNQPQYKEGSYIFLDQPITDMTAFANSFLGSSVFAAARFAWINDPNSTLTGPALMLDGNDKTGDLETFTFANNQNISLAIGGSCQVSLDSNNDRFLIAQPSPYQSIYLSGNGGTPLYVGQTLYLPVAAGVSGCLQFQIEMTEADMDENNLDIGCRYYVDDPDGGFGGLISQRYPIFSLPQGTLSLMGSMDVLDAFDPDRSFFSFNYSAGSGQPIAPASIQSYFRTHTGQVLTLTPNNDARLIFSVSSQSNPPSDTDPVYLVPQGSFLFALNGGQQAAQTNGGPALRLMCGFAGTEYFGLAQGQDNTLTFIPNQPAYSPNFWSQGDTDGGDPLSASATTSWMNITPATVPAGAQGTAAASQLGYYAQPQNSELFAAGFPVGGQASAGTSTTTGSANFLGFREIYIPVSATDDANPFPMVPYGGITPVTASSQNLAVLLENKLLSPYRRQVIGNGGATASVRAAQETDGSNNATTPQGLLANVSESTWNTLTLGKSNTGDQGGGQDQLLTLTDVSSDLQSALQTNQQFLVISWANALNFSNSVISITGWSFDLSGTSGFVNDPEPTAASFKGDPDLSPIDGLYITSVLTFTSGALSGKSSKITAYTGKTNLITVSPAFPQAPGQFDKFEISVSQQEQYDNQTYTSYTNVVIFKFYNDTIKNLSQNTSAWAGKGTPFNFDVADVSKFLQTYISQAEDELTGGNYRFQSFVDLINNPRWNGILCLNVKLPIDQLPQEVQGLLGGINLDKFSAHHFGIETNSVSADFSLNESSLFGLVNYENKDDSSSPAALDATTSPYDFKVNTLQVVFANSEVTDFTSEIAVTINELFSQPANLDPSLSTAANGNGGGTGNTVILNGSYEDHNGVSTYTFVASGTYVFDLNSEVIKQVEFTKVQFTTSTSDDSSGDITSSFSFWGKLTFGQFLNFDFFSFDDLYFADLSLSFTFNAKNVGSDNIPLQDFTFDPGNLRFDVSISKPRPDSLLGRFPLQLTGFTYASAGVTISDLGYNPLQVPLIPDKNSTASTILDNDIPMMFALTMTIDLGSIGGLSSPLKGFAADIVAGWNPSPPPIPTDPNANMTVGIGFKLPESTGGKMQIGIEGVLLLTINNFLLTKLAASATPDADDESSYYLIYLNGCTLDVLGTTLPPGGNFSFLFFVPQGESTNSALSNLGWYVAYTGADKAPAQLTAGDEGGNGGGTGDGGGSTFLKVAYLGLGQRVQLPDGVADAQTVSDVLKAMQEQLTPAETDPDKLKQQLAKIYNRDKDWIVGGNLTLFDTLTLGAVYYDPSTYGLLVGIASGKLGPLGGFNFEILYKKITDTIGVYQIQLTLPDSLRQLQFGSVSITIPVIGVDIYTNGNFKIDVGFPNGTDFSNSLSVQVFPFVGYGGFYYAQLSSATATNVPALPSGTFNPVLEFGFGLSLGVGKTIDQGIFKAGLTVTFVGILEGVVAYWVKPGSGSQGMEVMFNQAPDYYSITGQIAIVGNLYGSVDFGIIKAGVSLTISAGAGLTWKAYDNIVLSIYASVSVKVTVVIGGFKIFGHRIEIKISFSFSTTISYSWTIPDNRTPPWATLPSGQTTPALSADRSELLAAAQQYQPLTWTPVQIYAAQPIRIYFQPQVTVAVPVTGSSPQTQLVALLIVNTQAVSGQTFSDFDYLASAMLGWAINQYLNPTPASYNSNLAVNLLDLENLSVQLSDPSTSLPDYASLTAMLNLNFAASVSDVPTDGSDPMQPNVFPMIPNVILSATGQQNIAFDSYNMQPQSYLDFISEYFAQMLVNFETSESPSLMAAENLLSMATVIFQDYFALIIKAAVSQASQYMQGLESQAPASGDTFTISDPNTHAIVATSSVNDSSPTPNSFIGGPELATDVYYNGYILTFTSGNLKGAYSTISTYTGMTRQIVVSPSFQPPIQLGTLLDNLQKEAAFSGIASQAGRFLLYGLQLPSGSSVDDPSPTASTFKGGPELSTTDSFYDALELTFTAGPLSGQSSTISSYTGATRQIVVSQPFTPAPNNGDTFVLISDDTAAQMAKLPTSPLYALVGQQVPLESTSSVSGAPTETSFAGAAGLSTADSFYNGCLLTFTGGALDGQSSTVSSYTGATRQIVVSSPFTQAPATGDAFVLWTSKVKLVDPNPTQQKWFTFQTPSSVSGTPTPSSFDGSPELSDADGFYVGSGLKFTGGALAGQEQNISAYTGATRNIVVGSPFSAAPNANDPFVIAVSPMAVMDPTQIGTVADLVQTYSTYQPTVHVSQLPNLVQQPVSYTLQRPVPLSIVNGPTTEWTIWPFPNSLMSQLANSLAAPLELVLKQGTIGDPSVNQSSVADVDYNWATTVNLTAQQIPLNGGYLPNTYQIGGTDETGRGLLNDLINLGAQQVTQVVDQVYLLYTPQSQGASVTPGMNADANIDTAATMLMKINLSTESAPPSEEVFALAAMVEAPADDYSAAMNQYYNFFKLVWECSIVNAGGYYLYYKNENSSDNGLPSYLFDSSTTTSLTLLITFKEGAQVASYNNCTVVTTSPAESGLAAAADDTNQSTVFYAEATNLLAWHAALEAGSIGFSLTCSDPSLDYKMPAGLAAPNGKQKRLTREDVKAALASTGIDKNHPEYDAKMAESGDQENTLMNLFNLLTYQIVGNGVFETSMQGLPVGPISPTGTVSDPDPQAGSFYANIGISATDDLFDGGTLTFTSGALNEQSSTVTGYNATTQQIQVAPAFSQAPADGDAFTITSSDWYYQQGVAIYSWYKTGNQNQNEDPYAGVGSQVLMDFQLRDLFGNALVSSNPLPTLTADYLYFDDLIPVSAWPGVQASYLCASEGGASNLEITLSFAGSTYMPTVGGTVSDNAATASSFIAASGLSSLDGYYVGSLVTFTSGALQGQTRSIIDYTAATRQIIVSEVFSQAPANDDTFSITVLNNDNINQGIEYYDSINYQLGGTGVSITMSTSLDPTEQPVLPLQQLQTFTAGIISFLTGLINNPQNPNPPAPTVFSYPIPLEKREANSNNIFEVTVAINIERESALVDPSVRTTPVGSAPSLALIASASISPQVQWNDVAGSVGSGASTTTSFFAASGLSSINGFYNGGVLTFMSGALMGQSPTISNYDGATGQITVSPALSQAPATGDAFTIAPKNGLTLFGMAFENAFPELRAATGLGSAGPKSLFAVRIGVIQQGDNGITVNINSANPIFFAPKPLSNVLLSRPSGVFGPVGVIKYSSGGPVPNINSSVTGTGSTASIFNGGSNLSNVDNSYVGGILTFTSGALNGQSAMITGYVGASQQIYVSPSFSQAPATGDSFMITVPVPTTFQDVDLDVFARSFVSAVDQFLSPATAVPARQINPDDYRRVIMAKQALAEEIAMGITWVLNTDWVLSLDPQTLAIYIAAAQEAFKQRLLVSLSSDYNINTIVQYSATVTAKGTEEPVPPNLYGQVVRAAAAPSDEDDDSPDFSLSTAKLSLSTSTQDSLLTFLFDTKQNAQANIQLAMQYKVTHIEHDISQTSDEGYTSSSWLTLITSDTDPATGLPDEWPVGNFMPVGATDIPVPLRVYPTPPTLQQQNALMGASENSPSSDGSGSLLEQRKWHYEYQYQQSYIAQDTVGVNVEFNISKQENSAFALAVSPGNDLFYWLARFSVEYPQIAPDLAKVATAQPGDAVAEYAIKRFADLIWGAAYDTAESPPPPNQPPDPTTGPWARWVDPEGSLNAMAAMSAQALSQYEYIYQVEQSDPTVTNQVITLSHDFSTEESLFQAPDATSSVTGSTPTPSTFQGGTELSSEDGSYNEEVLAFTSGALNGQASTIINYTGGNRAIQVSPAFPQAPADGDAFTIGSVPFPDIEIQVVSSSVSDTPQPSQNSFAGGPELSTSSDSAYNNCLVSFTTGILNMQTSRITAYSAATRTITVDPAFPAAPAVNDKFTIELLVKPDTQQAPPTAVYKFTNPNPSSDLTRKLVFTDLDVMGTENAWGGIQLSRNLVLVEGIQTNPLFVYQTPTVRFVNKVTPLIDSYNPIDIARIVSDAVADDKSTVTSFDGGSDLSQFDRFYVGGVLTFTSGNLSGQSATITQYTGAARNITVSPAFPQPPAQGDTFVIDIDVVSSAVADSQSTPTSFDGDQKLSSVDDFYAGGAVTFTSGNLTGQTVTITQYAGATRTISVSPALAQGPAQGDSFTINQVTPQTEALVNHLAALFAALFAVSGENISAGSRTIRVGCSYGYDVREGKDSDQSNPVMAYLPVLLCPPFSFELPSDLSTNCSGSSLSFVCQLAQSISTWFSNFLPSTNGGMFVFDISVFASLTTTNLPVLRIRDVYLDYQYITLPLYPPQS